MRNRIKTAALLTAVLLIAAACSGGDDSGGDDDSGAGGGALVGAPMEVQKDLPAREAEGADTTQESFALDDAAGTGGSTTAGGAARLPTLSASVIKTASIDVEVARDGLQDALQDAIAIAGRHQGFVLSSAIDREHDRRGTLVIRIPSARFESALADLEDLGKLTQEQISGEDVGQEFIDLEARLRNWRAQESVLISLMERATTIDETIRVQNELSQVRLEIEQIQGRLRYLRDQTSFGTITASFLAAGIAPESKPGQLERAWQRALDLARGFVSGLIVSTGVVVPVALLAAIVLLILRQLRPRLERLGG